MQTALTAGDRRQSRQSTTLEALFPGPGRLIVGALFGEPERWWSLPELAGRAGRLAGSLRAHLGRLRNGGIVREKIEDGRSWFQPDPEGPIFGELRSIVIKLTNGDDAETILVVEDEPATARITRILLESWGYRVFESTGGDEAMAIFEQHAEDIRLLVTDIMMPGMTGTKLADELQRRRPQLRVVFMSGYAADAMEGRDAAFLPKPFNPASLSRIVRKELDKADRPPRKMKAL